MAYIVNNKVFSDIAEAKNYLDQTGTSGTIFYSNPTMSADLYPVSTYTPKSATTVKTNSLFEMPFGDDIGPSIPETNPFEQPEFGTIEPDSFERETLQEWTKFLEDTLRQEEYQRFIMRNFFDTSDLDEGAEPVEFNDMQDDTFQMILDSILGQAEDVPPEIRGDALRTQQWLENQLSTIGQEIQNAGGYEEWLASQQEEPVSGPVKGDAPRLAPLQPDPEEVVGDIDEDTTAGDTGLEDEIGVDPDMPITDPELDPLDEITTDQEAEEQEEAEEEELGILDRIGQWIQSQIGGGTGGAGGGTSSTPPFLPGSAGVIISPGSAGMSWPEILADPGKWTVFLPGVIPGLPESPTILGTIEDILSRPGDVLGGLWNDLVTTVSNPEQVLEDILNDAADSEGLITIGGIAGVISGVLDTLGDAVNRDDEGNIVVNESGSILGGAGEGEDESQGEVIVQPSDDKGGSQMGTAPVMDPVQPQPTEGLPIADDSTGPVKGDAPRLAPISDEPQQPELGGSAPEEVVAAAGGAGGGMLSKKGAFTPFMASIGYAPVQLQQQIRPDYVRELDGMLLRLMQGKVS